MTVPTDVRVASLVSTGRLITAASNNNLGFWRQAAGSAPNGSSTFTCIVVVQPTPAARTLSGGSIIADTDGGTVGFRIFWDPPTTGIRFQLFDGGGVSRIVDRNVTLAALDSVINYRRSWVVTCVYNSTVQMVTRISGVGETIGGPFTGYSPRNAEKSVLVGTGSGIGCCFWVSAILADDTVALDAAGRASVEAAVINDLEQGRSIRSGLLSANEIYWDARDCDYTLGSWPVRRGTANALARNFAPESHGLSARF